MLKDSEKLIKYFVSFFDLKELQKMQKYLPEKGVNTIVTTRGRFTKNLGSKNLTYIIDNFAEYAEKPQTEFDPTQFEQVLKYVEDNHCINPLFWGAALSEKGIKGVNSVINENSEGDIEYQLDELFAKNKGTTKNSLDNEKSSEINSKDASKIINLNSSNGASLIDQTYKQLKDKNEKLEKKASELNMQLNQERQKYEKEIQNFEKKLSTEFNNKLDQIKRSSTKEQNDLRIKLENTKNELKIQIENVSKLQILLDKSEAERNQLYDMNQKIKIIIVGNQSININRLDSKKYYVEIFDSNGDINELAAKVNHFSFNQIWLPEEYVNWGMKNRVQSRFSDQKIEIKIKSINELLNY